MKINNYKMINPGTSDYLKYFKDNKDYDSILSHTYV